MSQASPSAVLEKVRAEAALFDSSDCLLNFSPKGDFQSPLAMESSELFFKKWQLSKKALPLGTFFPITETFTAQKKIAAEDTLCSVLKGKGEDFGETNLYLVLGFLKWDGNALAPSLLIPLDFDAVNKSISVSQRAPIENIVLRNRLKDEVNLPKSEDAIVNGEFNLSQYYALFEKAISVKKNWRFTRNGLCIAFFNTNRFLLQKKLEAIRDNKEAESNSVLNSLLREEGFEVKNSIFDENTYDSLYSPADHHFLYQVDSHANRITLDALNESSGAFAIQALPGTEKMKVAANIVAESVSKSQKTLVVYRRATTQNTFQNSWKPPFRTFAETDWDGIAAEVRTMRKQILDYYNCVNKPIQPAEVLLPDLLNEFSNARPAKHKFSEKVLKNVGNINFKNYTSLKKNIADLLELYSEKNGIEVKNAFEGVQVLNLSSEDREQLSQTLDAITAKSAELATFLEQLKASGICTEDVTLEKLAETIATIKENFSEETPLYEQWQLRSPSWEDYKDTILELPTAAEQWGNYRRQPSEIFTENAVDANILAVRDDFAESQKATLKGLSERYRTSKRQLLQVIRNPKSVESDAALLELADRLIEIQGFKKTYKESTVLGNSLFGKDWLYDKSNWSGLDEKIQYLYEFRKKFPKGAKLDAILQLLEQWHLLKEFLPQLEAFEKTIQELKNSIQQLSRTLDFSMDLESLGIRHWSVKINQWRTHWESLDIQLQLSNIFKEIEQYNCPGLYTYLQQAEHVSKDIEQAVIHYWTGSQIQAVTKTSPDLFTLSPKARSQKHKKYRELLDKFCNANFRRLHDTLKDCPELLTTLSLSEALAQPALDSFDVAIILDADGITAAEALPVISSASRTILIGDPHNPSQEQLPYDAYKDTSTAHTVLFQESVMAYSLRQGIASGELQLNSQYADVAMVRFANEHIYSNGIKQFPKAGRETFRGNHLKLVDDKVTAIAQAAIAHAEKHPGQTLGIIAFHQSTCLEIEESIKAMLLMDSPAARFFTPKNHNISYYVKTPERAIDRYRDVILVCVEPEGISGASGDRKIAVCATLAKSEITAYLSETDLTKPQIAKQTLLHQWIDFLQAKEVKEDETASTATSSIKPLIIKELQKEEILVEENFSHGGIPVGPVVVDANNPKRFLAVIEDDCTTEAFRESVEDRLYVRPVAFQQLGWKVMNMWLPFWFIANADEVSHLIATIAIEQSVAPPPPEKTESEDNVSAESEGEDTSESLATVDYIVQHPKIEGTAHDKPIVELPAEALIIQLKFYVDHEAPIHEEVLKQRLLELHHVDRSGPVLQKALQEALKQGLQKKNFIKTGPFFYSLKAKDLQLRNRAARPDQERKLAFVSPEERALLPQSMDEYAIKQTLGLLE